MPMPILVLTWSEMDGSRKTDRTEYRDGCHRAVYEPCRNARAVVWSRSTDQADWDAAGLSACRMGGTVHLLPDTDDVLDIARALELNSYSGAVFPDELRDSLLTTPLVTLPA